MGKEYYIILNGEKIAVTEEVYRAYKQPVWKESKRAKVRADMEYSYDGMLEDGMEIASDDALVEDIVTDKLLLDTLLLALDELSDDERRLIDGLYYKDQTLRDYARQKDTNHTKVIRQHKRVIEKLRDILKKNL